MTCPVVYTSDTMTCRRCRAQWDAGDHDGKCARPRKPLIAVRELPNMPSYYEAFVTWPIHPKRVAKGATPTRGRIGIYRSRNRAYEQAMNWVEDRLKANAKRLVRGHL